VATRRAVHPNYNTQTGTIILSSTTSYTQAIAQGDACHTEGEGPGDKDGKEQGRIRPTMTWVISYSENGKK